MNLLAREHGWKRVVIFGANLGKQSPVGMLEQVDEKHPGGGQGLANGLGGPMLLELQEQKVVAKLSFGECGWIATEVLVNKPESTVIREPGSFGVVAKGQVVGR